MRKRQEKKGIIEDSSIKKRLFDTAVEMMGEPWDSKPSYLHSVFCQTSLPYRNPGDDVRVWNKTNGNVFLSIEAGRAMSPTGFVDVPVPYGPKARLALIHFNTEAIRNQSPVIEVENSFTGFVSAIMGKSPNGPALKAFKMQMGALNSATIRMGAVVGENQAKQINTQITSGMDLWFPSDPRQKVLWPSTVQLDSTYYESLLDKAVPLDHRAVAALGHNAMALDIYSWLSQRLHRVPKGKGAFVPWAALYAQFGGNYGAIRVFRKRFIETLKQVRTQYHDAKIDIEGTKGLRLWNSAPPVAYRSIKKVSK